MNNVLNLGDEEGIGEKDDEVIADVPAEIITDEAAGAEPEEFVDGEEAFVDADEESLSSINTESDAGTLDGAASADDQNENTNEEINNV